MPRQLYRRFRLLAISPAWPFEFEAAVVWDIYLFIRVIDQEQVRAEPQTAEVRGRAELIEIRRGQPRLFRMLHHAARIDAVDSATVVQVEGERDTRRGRDCHVSFALPAARILESIIPRNTGTSPVATEQLEGIGINVRRIRQVVLSRLSSNQALRDEKGAEK